MKKTVAIIPARMGSTRFPGKPLADICGMPMIEHVRMRTAMCPRIDEVYVATCDQEIFDVVTAAGGQAVMTADTHERCTDRIAEAAVNLDAEIVVNVQGDEPLINPDMLTQLLEPFDEDTSLPCTNLMAEIDNDRDFRSSDVVKTVTLPSGNALYFSREPIPSGSHCKEAYRKFKQLGIIAFKSDFLQTFTHLPPTPLEKVESVDMLRAVEHGYPVRMVLTDGVSIGVDTQADLERAEGLMRQDTLAREYLSL